MTVWTRVADKPQYVFHPLRSARRLWRSVAPGQQAQGEVVTQLPWGQPLRVALSDAIGYSIATGKVFDPCVTETVHRLVDPGDLAVDVGANVGYLTSLMAVRAGVTGQVIAVEPQPVVFSTLSANIASWSGAIAPVDAQEVALSDTEGEGQLVTNSTFAANMGLSSLKRDDEVVATGDTLFSVALRRLDDLVGDRQVGLLKVDVEGHEHEVLRGASALLERGAVRDLVFEDHGDYPNPVTQLVEDAGLHLFALENHLLGIRLVAPGERRPASAWPGPSYLATTDPDRARERLAAAGWQVPGIVPKPLQRLATTR